MSRSRPKSIAKEAIEQAIKQFDSEATHSFGPSKLYDLLYEGRRYPPKAIVGLAAHEVTGCTYGPHDVHGGNPSNRVLQEAGFEIVYKPNIQTMSEELPPDEKYVEGASRQVKVNSYERDAKARQAAIKYHGCKCKVCGFDFETTYGAIGSGFIHVHHVVPLSSIRKGYVVDPKKDLRPVCPNCHAMLHRKITYAFFRTIDLP